MIESLGLTEEATGMKILSSMDVVKVGTVSSGDVWMDRNCHEADGVLILNRVKLHTCFSGPVQSGLTKMLVVGMGKIQSASTFHSAPTPQMKDMLLEMGASCWIPEKSSPVWPSSRTATTNRRTPCRRRCGYPQTRTRPARTPPPLLPLPSRRRTPRPRGQ